MHSKCIASCQPVGLRVGDKREECTRSSGNPISAISFTHSAIHHTHLNHTRHTYNTPHNPYPYNNPRRSGEVNNNDCFNHRVAQRSRFKSHLNLDLLCHPTLGGPVPPSFTITSFNTTPTTDSTSRQSLSSGPDSTTAPTYPVESEDSTTIQPPVSHTPLSDSVRLVHLCLATRPFFPYPFHCISPFTLLG